MAELRRLTADDYLQHRQLMSHAFSHGAIVTPPTEVKEPTEETIGIFADGTLVSALTTCPFTVYWPGAQTGTLKMGGIAGVATYAEARGNGHVERLLQECLVRMRAAGQVVSALFPFSWAFYQRYGWDAVGEKRVLTLPLRELPAAGRNAVRLSEAEALARIPPLYGAAAARYRGAFTTETRSWPGPLAPGDNKTTYAYTTDGGYLLWRYGDRGEVREYLSMTPAADDALLHLLRDLGMQTRLASVTLPCDEALSTRVRHWDLEVRAEPVFSARVVDLAAALALLNSDAAPGSVVLAVEDRYAPWNAGVWKVSREGLTIRCERSDAAPQVQMDIRAFSQAFWGSPDLEALRRAGRVSVEDEAGFAWLKTLLPPHPVMCWNAF